MWIKTFLKTMNSAVFLIGKRLRSDTAAPKILAASSPITTEEFWTTPRKILMTTATVEIKKTCPLPKKCMVQNIVYKATLKPSNVNYVGMTSTDFKARYRNHVYSFKHGKKSTTLATYVSDNKLNPTPRIKWEILKRCRPYRPGHRYCDICTSEKVFINRNSINPKKH